MALFSPKSIRTEDDPTDRVLHLKHTLLFSWGLHLKHALPFSWGQHLKRGVLFSGGQNLKHALLFGLCFLLTPLYLWSQSDASSWRDHLSYRDASLISLSGSTVSIASAAGIARYDKTSGTFEYLSKVTGLSDAGISALTYSEEYAAAIIGYSDGNIDIRTGGRTYNINDLKRNSTYTSKKINHILCVDDAAYLSCDFGIVKIDLRRRVISETWLIGDGGSALQVNELTIWNALFCAATAQGVRQGPVSGSALTDHTHWTLVTGIPNNQGVFTHIASTSQKLLVSYNQQYLYQFNGIQWTPYSLPDENTENIVQLSGSGQRMLVVRTHDVFSDNANLTTPLQIINQTSQSLLVRNAKADAEGTLWMADLQKGLVEYPANGTTTFHTPQGPAAPLNGTMVFRDNALYATGGDHDLLPGIISMLTSQRWNNITDPDHRNLGAMDVSPVTPGQWAVGAKDQGLLLYQNQILATQYTPANSPIEAPSGLIRISGLRYDAQGVLWGVQQNASKPVVARLPDGSWKSFSWAAGNHPGILHFDLNGQGWITTENDGLFVFNNGGTPTDESDDRTIRFFPHTVFGQTIRTTYCIANDLNGSVWIGTESGPVIFPNPASITQGIGTGGTHILVPGEDEPEMVFPLLGSEPILSIAVDGANQKWLGTATGGVFLLSGDGQQQLAHFTTSNSPLPSDQVTGIAVNDYTGEVYFQTEYGIVGYRGTAVAAGPDFTKMYAYPNPVRESFEGNITITGLVQDTHLKVTDISGNLVYETVSQGGQAFWDGRNLRGKRVATGVYLIFCSNRDGTQTHIGKLLFIH